MTQFSLSSQQQAAAQPYDFIAIGIGPFNLGLACLTQPLSQVNALFIDQNSGFDWHPGMMLESAHLQTPFMADLVTLADPTHPLSFLNYIKQQGRLYSFYIRESFFLMRKEYNQYCRWATERLSNLRFNTKVERVEFDQDSRCYQVHCSDTRNGQKLKFETRHLVLGTGPSPVIPECCQPFAERMVHSGQYLHHKEDLQTRRSITVVGSGQSAAEIYYDLLSEIDKYGYQLNWVTRAPRFFPLEYTKLTLEMTSPEYVDYFHQLPAEKRDQLNMQSQQLYKGINSSLINDIFDLLYIKRLDGHVNTRLFTNTALTGVQNTANHKTLNLALHQHEQDQHFAIDSEAVILCTGYRHQPPAFYNRSMIGSRGMTKAVTTLPATTRSINSITRSSCKTPSCILTVSSLPILVWPATATHGSCVRSPEPNTTRLKNKLRSNSLPPRKPEICYELYI